MPTYVHPLEKKGLRHPDKKLWNAARTIERITGGKVAYVPFISVYDEEGSLGHCWILTLPCVDPDERGSDEAQLDVCPSR